MKEENIYGMEFRKYKKKVLVGFSREDYHFWKSIYIGRHLGRDKVCLPLITEKRGFWKEICPPREVFKFRITIEKIGKQKRGR